MTAGLAAGRTPRRLIAVVGNNAASPAQVAAAEAVGAALATAGYRLVCGGRGGVMEAACRGARGAPGYAEGGTVELLPSSDPADANPYVDVVLPTGLGFARNTLVALAGEAMVVVGGAAGTLSEVALAWQLGRPIVALTLPGEHGGWGARLAGSPVDARPRPPVAAAASADEVVAWLSVTLA